MKTLSAAQIRQFQATILDFYTQHARVMPWRNPDQSGTYDPYKIMVSEIMLQQTQVARVIPKYTAFLEQFPSLSALASASLADVLTLWSGLGYNRRAKFLWQAAQIINQTHGSVPYTLKELEALPGIGHNTAAAIIAYSYDEPVVFVETNIRSVFIHHFFEDVDGVTDAAILELVKETLPQHNIRQWFYALMDYGAYLKAKNGNVNVRSKTYTKQSTFAGSVRRLRGEALRLLTVTPMTYEQLKVEITDDRLDAVLASLIAEQLVHIENSKYQLG